LEFLNSEPYYASKKIVNQSSDFPVCRTGSYRHKKALEMGMYYAAIVQWDTTVMVSVSATRARTHQCQQNYHYMQDFILDYVSWSKKNLDCYRHSYGIVELCRSDTHFIRSVAQTVIRFY